MAIMVSSEDQKKINTVLMDFHTARNSLHSVRVIDPDSARTMSRAVDTLRSIGQRLTGLGLEFNREVGFDDE